MTMLHIFLNPTANRGGALARWQRVEAELNRRQRDFKLYQLETPEDLNRQVLQVWREGGRHFAAAGGDGTLQLLTEALMKHLTPEQRSETVLGAIGIGTSNDFHKPGGKRPERPEDKTAGGPVPELLPASPLWDGVPCRLDDSRLSDLDVMELTVTRPDGGSETHWFLQAVHAGSIPAANHCLTRGGGWCEWMYHRWYGLALHATALYTVFTYSGFEGTVEVAGSAFTGTFTGMTLLKRCNIAGQFVFATRRTAADGLVDLGLCRKASPWRLLQLTMAFADQGFAGHPEVEFREISELKARFSSPQWLDYDGELVQATGIALRVIPKALKMLS